LGSITIIGGQEVEEGVDGLGQGFGLAIAIYYNDQRTAGGLSQKDRINGLSSGGEARD